MRSSSAAAARRQDTGGTIRMRCTGRSGPVQNTEIKLPKDLRCAMSWRFEDAPADLVELAMDQLVNPQFVTVCPNALRFSHLPDCPQVLVECRDVLVAFE